MSRVFAQESFQNEHMRDLLEEVEDQLSNSLKELNQKSQEAQRYKVPYLNQEPRGRGFITRVLNKSFQTMLEASNVKLEQMREIIREKDQIIQVRNLKPKPKMANF